MTREEIIAKVQKLLALGTSSNEHEAALAAAKAREFLSRHNLDMAEVLARGEDTPDLDVIEDGMDLGYGDRVEQYVWNVVAAVAKSFECQYFLFRRPVAERTAHGRVRMRKQMVFVGTPADVEACSYTVNYLLAEMGRFWRRASKEMQHRRFSCTREMLKRSYMLGMARTISETIRAESARIKQQEASCTDLMIVKEQRVKDYMASNHDNLRTINTRGTTIDPSAFQRGQRDGASVSVRPGVGGGQQRAAIR